MSGESESIAPAMTAELPRRERLDWLDAVKGIGILAVVAGHVWTRGPLRDAIYGFHMPLFFMVSGYLARPMPLGVAAPRLLRAVVPPFLCFSVLLLGTDMLVEGLRGFRPIFATPWLGLETILLATDRLRGPFTILWFIPCLLVARLAWTALVGTHRRATHPLVFVAMAGTVALAILAFRLGKPSPLGLIAVPGALLMLWAGALWQHFGHPSRWLVVPLGAFALIALALAAPINMKLGDFGSLPALAATGAVAATLTIGLLARGLPALPLALLGHLGRASLVIMYAHVAFVHYLAPYAPRIALFVAALAGSLLIERAARMSRPSRILLLGEKR